MAAPRIPLSGGPRLLRYEEDWEVAGQILNADISLATREKIQVVCSAFSTASEMYSTNNSVSKTTLLDEINLWQIATQRLCHLLQMPLSPDNRSEAIAEAILPFHTDENVATFSRMPPIGQLQAVAQLAHVVGRSVVARIEGENGNIKPDLWSAWVCLIARYLQLENVTVTASTDEINASKFVRYIEHAQHKLPQSCQRRRTYESTAKGIQDARRQFGHLTDQELLLIIAGWGFGVLRNYAGMPDKPNVTQKEQFKGAIKASLSALKSRLSSDRSD